MALEGCNKHPTVRAEYRCQQCSKPVCSKCIVNDRFCSDACNRRYSSFMSNYRKPVDTKRSPIFSIIFFAVIAGGIYFLAKKLGYLH